MKQFSDINSIDKKIAEILRSHRRTDEVNDI